MNTKTLAQSLRDEATAKVAEAMAEAESKIKVAEAFDATGCQHRPWIFSGNTKPAYDGDMGSLSFRDVTPDVAAELMDMFPPVPTVYYKGRFVGVRPRASLDANAEDVTVTEDVDGFKLRLSGGIGYGQHIKLEWSAMLGNLQVGFSLDLKSIHGLMPRIVARYKYHGSEPFAVESSDLVWPEMKYPRPTVTKYSRGSNTAFNDFLCYGTQMRAMVQAWVDELNHRGEITRAAYEKDKANQPPKHAMASDLVSRARYDAEKLRPGTFEQWFALRTPEATNDRALAEKHWQAYCADPANGMAESPVKPSKYQDYFDHYCWTCNYLRRLGLYEVEHNGKPYKYGSAWL